MKILEIIQKHFASLGITSPHQSKEKNPFNGRVFFGFLMFGCVIASQSLYIFHVANGFMEHIQGISQTSASFIIFVCFATFVFERNVLFECIGNLEELIEASKTSFQLEFWKFWTKFDLWNSTKSMYSRIQKSEIKTILFQKDPTGRPIEWFIV